jgi:hypothetical protein
VSTVNGVLSSCDTLAMKSRTRATASSRVTSRLMSAFLDPERYDLHRERRCASRID